MPAQTKPTIVFCHGIWADGSCFSKVIPALQADGYEVIAVQYGLDSYDEDLATVKRTLNRVGSPVLLVGHSYGGATITGAGVDERVVGLVYIAAVAPDAGETVQEQLDKYPSDIFSRVEVADGRAWMLPNGTEFFAGDLSKEDQKLVWANHYAPVYNLFQQQKLSADKIAWRSKPSWYILATQDHTVHPDLQRWVSKRMGATVTEVANSLVPMLSQPDVVIAVIRKARLPFKKADRNKHTLSGTKERSFARRPLIFIGWMTAFAPSGLRAQARSRRLNKAVLGSTKD
jgi:pimeloyl-ACP methyl ester carboxylesterase